MEEIMKQFLINAPFLAITLYMLDRLYTDMKAERVAASLEREKLYVILDDTKDRIARIEAKIFGFTSIPGKLKPVDLDGAG